MCSIKNSLALTVSLLSVAFVVALVTPFTMGQTKTTTTTSATTAQPIASVNVINTPNVNIANTPSVNLSGTPTVNLATGANVGISGTPTFALSGTPSVNIANDQLPVRDVDNPAKHPFQTQSGILSFGNTPYANFNVLVPPNKRLVVEHVSVLAILAFGANQRALISVDNAGGSFYLVPQDAGHFFVTGSDPAGPHYFILTSPMMHVYASGGVNIRVIRNDLSGGDLDSTQIALSGYLGDVP